MALNIKNKEVEDLTKELAQEVGSSQVEVMLKALRLLRQELQAEKTRSYEERRRGLLVWLEERRRNPVKPAETREEIEADLYDENGLPK